MDGNIEDSSHPPTHGTVFCHVFFTAIEKNLRHPSSNSWDTEFAQLVLYLPHSVPTGCGQPEGKWYQYGRGHPAGRSEKNKELPRGRRKSPSAVFSVGTQNKGVRTGNSGGHCGLRTHCEWEGALISAPRPSKLGSMYNTSDFPRNRATCLRTIS